MAVVAYTIAGYSQSSVKEYYDDKGIEKVKKAIVKEREPETGKSFKDGHGAVPYLTSPKQIPETLALVTFYVYDKGTQVTSPAFITTYSLSEKGGNYFANQIHKASIDKLKETFKAHGIVLLTPDEYLNTPEKREFYYKQFKPNVSKLGSVLSGLESGSTDIAVSADHYRALDVAAAGDFRRSESLNELAQKLGVNSTLSICFELMAERREISINGIKWSINGPNPNPKEDKKYVAENMGNGYYTGQVYYKAYTYFPNSIRLAKENKKAVSEENYAGIDMVLAAFVEKSVDSWKEAIEKTSK
ncbi:MAG: hypothetical protein K0Q79_1578 [Flavipsychrobacter sp.]|nr:hypothetical protein [Flavipsychrobacter sp.]